MAGLNQRTSIVARLVNSANANRSEATIQSDIRMLLLDPELMLNEDELDVPLETPVGDLRRIDIEVGCTVIEVKRSIQTQAAINTALPQLSGYVQTRTDQMGQRYVGILTDGRLWIAFHEVDGDLKEASRHVAAAGDVGSSALLQWLEGVLATRKFILPTPEEIKARLGAQSSSHDLDYSTLEALYADSRDHPTVVLKRDLWADLLKSALGTQFTNSDELFLEHTLLVNSAEIIAHLVLGLNAEELSPATLLSGDQFNRAGIHGVVDRDFFDWVLEVPGGDGYIAALARRLSRFNWSKVEHDVLKVLYESVISAETRKALGEYYTPDWLAKKIVDEVIDDPLNQRVLDPSCGSGTFLFYAVRRFLASATEDGMTLADAMSAVSSQVIGIDLHPVAVALARVTYVLALGRDALNAEGRGSVSVPVYLGDSLGWEQRDDLLSLDQLVIPTNVGDQILSGELRFPDHLLADSAIFDQLVEALVDESGRAANKSTNGLSVGTLRRLSIHQSDVPALNENFARLKQLHEADRDHIWSYYIRNVARPEWLSREENRVDVLIGNPPWLSYRHMTSEMQNRFKELAQERGFWSNETTATHQDLAGLFVARAAERYLNDGGALGFVVPNSVIDRDYWSGFRSGSFSGANVHFEEPWDLRRIRPHLFPRGSAVIFGTRAARAHRMPTDALIWTGKAPARGVTAEGGGALTSQIGAIAVVSGDHDKSPYSDQFSQGATLVPRYMFRVKRVEASALGVPSGRAQIQSERSSTEKKPWKDRADLTGTVETEFLWPVVLGESIIPYRLLDLPTFVIPLTTRGEVLDIQEPQIDAYPGVADWFRAAQSEWVEHGKGTMTLTQQIDHMSKLSQQMPQPPLRIAYAASGMHVAAALIRDQQAIIDTKAYWSAVRTEAEGNFLVGILNAPSVTTLVRPLMSYGKDERDIHKHVWRLPIPMFDPSNEVHSQISELARELTDEMRDRKFRSPNFVTIRQDARKWLNSDHRALTLDELVQDLLAD